VCAAEAFCLACSRAVPRWPAAPAPAQIARLRKAAAERATRGAPSRTPFDDDDTPSAPSAAPSAAAPSAPDASQLRRSLKVVWNRRDGDYSAAALRAIFAAFGPVEDVILKDGRKARAGALVLMATAAAAVRLRAAHGGAVLCCACVKRPALTRCVCVCVFRACSAPRRAVRVATCRTRC
jgi:hypothetical protein